MKKVFVSGCFDILHGGHIEFFQQAKALGDYLIVSFASDEVLWKYKERKSSMPEEHKKAVLSSLKMVDEVLVGRDLDVIGLEFKDEFINVKPDILAVTEDDGFAEVKQELCKKTGTQYVVLPKTCKYKKISTTSIRRSVTSPIKSPVRVDFCGGWLDVPHLSRSYSYIVNCTITPMVDLFDWQYEKKSGVGGSAAWQYLLGEDCVQKELDMGAGWQDPAIIKETGLCVWRSGVKPILECKINPDWLYGRMALLFTGTQHSTKDLVSVNRDYEMLALSSRIGADAVYRKDINLLTEAVNVCYKSVQLKEGMEALASYGEICKKYCGSGHGGYALYIFRSNSERDGFVKDLGATTIEPYMKGVI